MKIRLTVVMFLVAAVASAAPLGTEFTYQGVLSDGGVPATGIFDFRCVLYDADVGGSQAGSIVYLEDLTVTEGRFTTELDFGTVFDGTALWLEVAVRDGGTTGAYTVLSPRHELTAAPFAQHAKSADVATSALNAGALDGQSGTYYLTWSNFIDIPADIADGDDDTLGALNCDPEEIARWDGSAWICSSDNDTPYVRTYVIGPVGTPVENGTAFDLAVGAISPPPSSDSPVMILIEPGTYDFGTSAQPLLDHTTYEGAGRDTTILTSAVCAANFYQGTFLTVVPSDFAVVRDLTIENTCADPAANSIAVSNQHDSARFENVALEAVGAAEYTYALFNSGAGVTMSGSWLHAENASDTNTGLLNWGDGVSLFDVEIDAIGGNNATGIDNNGTELTFREGRISAYWGTETCFGIFVHSDANNLRVEDSRVSATAGTAPRKVGVHIHGADATLINTEVGGITGIELDDWSNEFSTIQLFDVYSSATETGLWVFDHNDSGCQVMVDDGRYNAGVDAVVNAADACDVRIGGAYLANGVTGAAICAGVYDYGHTFYPNTCPP